MMNLKNFLIVGNSYKIYSPYKSNHRIYDLQYEISYLDDNGWIEYNPEIPFIFLSLLDGSHISFYSIEFNRKINTSQFYLNVRKAKIIDIATEPDTMSQIKEEIF